MKYILLFSLLAFSQYAFAGPGHDHGESAFAGGTGPATHFDLTDQQITNLDIKSAKAEFLPMQNAVDILAFTELLPERTSAVSPHFEGTIVNIAVKVGEKVKKGQPLVTLQPLNVGTKKVTFYAAIDGFVTQLNAGLGEIVPTSKSIMHVGDPSQMLVRGVAYETPDIKSIKVDQNVEVHIDIDPDRHIHGKVQRIDRVIDPESRTFSVYALIDTPNGDIQPGLQGTMEIFTGDDLPVLAVPKRAVLGELGSHFVYVIKDKYVEKRDVTIGVKTGHHIEIKSGLFPNERVVTNGNYQLQYISVGGIHEHDHGHDEQEGHSHNDGHDHSDEIEKDSHEGHDHENESHEDHDDHDDHSDHEH